MIRRQGVYKGEMGWNDAANVVRSYLSETLPVSKKLRLKQEQTTKREHRSMIQARRSSSGQCVMCGHPLVGFFQRLFSDRHPN